MKSLGLDLSLRATGFCITDSENILDKGAILSSKSTFAGPGELSRRIEIIAQAVERVVSENNPDIIVVEGYAMGSQGRVFDLGELGGVIKHRLYYLRAAGSRGEIHIAPPKTLKMFAGKGNADKDYMAYSAFKLFGFVFDDNNICDAFFLSILGHYKKSGNFRNMLLTSKQSLAIEGTSLFASREIQRAPRAS